VQLLGKRCNNPFLVSGMNLVYERVQMTPSRFKRWTRDVAEPIKTAIRAYDVQAIDTLIVKN
jgi:hypothetical protein